MNFKEYITEKAMVYNKTSIPVEKQLAGLTDKNGTQLKVGDKVRYQIGKAYEDIFEIYLDPKDGWVKFHFPSGKGNDMEGKRIRDAWYQHTDSKQSEIVNTLAGKE